MIKVGQLARDGVNFPLSLFPSLPLASQGTYAPAGAQQLLKSLVRMSLAESRGLKSEGSFEAESGGVEV
jgi:hypothetical protein